MDLRLSPDSPLVPANAPSPERAAVRERDERLTSLKSMVGQLAHDFKNLLVPQFGYVTLLKEEAAENPSLVGYAEKLENAARRTEQYLETILLAVRPQRRFHPKATDFAALVENSLKTWAAGLPASAAIQVRSDLSPCTLILDEKHWQIALQHLLNNARFALAGGGVVTVTLSGRDLTAADAAASGAPGGGGFELVVRDNGIGMKPDVLRRACEPFFTTRPKGQAAGLGLTVVHSVAQLHGGQVVLESVPDVGTTVTLWLPAKNVLPNEATGAYGRRLAEAAPGDSPVQLLLVESDPLVREALKTYLQQHLPCSVLVAGDATEGFRLLQKADLKVRLVVAETGALHLTGIELPEKMGNLKPEVRWILIGPDADATRDPVLAQFGDSSPLLIQKPFALKTLADAVRLQLT